MEQEQYLTLIRRAGLNEKQAKVYLILLEKGTLRPDEIANFTSENRTTVYSICDKLAELGLAERNDESKVAYTAIHPASLELLAEKRRKAMLKNEQVLKSHMNELVDLFFLHSNQPGVKSAEGLDAIKDVYEDEIATGQDVYILRCKADIVLGQDFWHDHRTRRGRAGVHTYALTPDTKYARDGVTSGRDAEVLFHRTLMPEDTYEGHLAVEVYGDKVTLLAFSDIAVATTIYNKAVAEGMRWMLRTLMEFYRATYDQSIVGELAPLP